VLSYTIPIDGLSARRCQEIALVDDFLFKTGLNIHRTMQADPPLPLVSPILIL
jgi:hypothetical protein